MREEEERLRTRKHEIGGDKAILSPRNVPILELSLGGEEKISQVGVGDENGQRATMNDMQIGEEGDSEPISLSRQALKRRWVEQTPSESRMQKVIFFLFLIFIFPHPFVLSANL